MSNDPTDLRGQERAQADNERRAKLLREIEDGDIKWLVSTKRGRRIAWRLLEQSGVFQPSFRTNALEMAFIEGNRNAGNRLLARITGIAPDAFTQMLNESKADKERLKRREEDDE